ncbi:MAG: PKD domain-containing protein [Thermoplasmata archaeon]|nr:PKD domain-containing protein [Thermoplasmata archaeon]
MSIVSKGPTRRPPDPRSRFRLRMLALSPIAVALLLISSLGIPTPTAHSSAPYSGSLSAAIGPNGAPFSASTGEALTYPTGNGSGAAAGAGSLAPESRVMAEVPTPRPPTAEEAHVPLVSYTLANAGSTPAAAGFGWTPYYGFCSSSFLEISSQGSTGPWGTPNGYRASTTSTFVAGLVPGHTYWWQVVYHSYFHSRLGCRGLMTWYSNVVKLTQPKVATLSATGPVNRSLQLSWTNSGTYAGLVTFGSYDLMRSTNGSAFTEVLHGTNSSIRSILVTDFTPGISEVFYLNTTDRCRTCPTSLTPSSSYSNALAYGPRVPLNTSISASRPWADVGQPFRLTCLATGGIHPFGYRYAWSFEDGTKATGPVVDRIFTAPGPATANCTATDATGANASTTFTLVVAADPTVAPPTADPVQGTVDQTVTLTTAVTGGSGGDQFNWSGLPTGCSSANVARLTCPLFWPGNFTITVTLTDASGYTTTSSPTPFDVISDLGIAPPTAHPARGEVGEIVTFTTAVSIHAGGDQFTWFGLPLGCWSANATSLACHPQSPGNFSITVALSNAGGYVLRSPPTPFEVAPATAIAPLTVTPGAVDVGQALAFGVSVLRGSGPYSYTFTGLPNGCMSSDQPTVTCHPTTSGSFQVEVRITDGANFTSRSTASVYVFPIPAVVWFNSSPAPIELGQTLTLLAQVSGGEWPLAISYQGLPPGCASVNSSYLSCVPMAGGSYNVSITFVDALGSVTSSFVTVAVAAPLAVTTLTVSSHLLALGEPLALGTHVQSGAPPYSFRYDGLPSGCTSANTTTLVCVPTGTGSFRPSVTVVDGAGVVAHASAEVVIRETPHGFLGFGLTANAVLLASVLLGIAVVVVAAAIGVTRRRRRSRE